jgi:hypothetical protein
MNDTELAIAWLQSFAIETWQRIAFIWTHQQGKLYETTLTQNLVFQLYYQFHEKKLPFELWEALDEKANGNDLELAVETSSGYLLLPCQAKIVRQSGRYSKMNYATNGKFQIESLLDYAQSIRGMAIYLLYNSSDNDSYIRRHWTKQYEQANTLGCSVVPAGYLYEKYCPASLLTGKRKWRIPSFEELHPTPGLPLHEFIKLLLEDSTTLTHQWIYYISQSKAKYYTYERIYDETRWKNLTPHPRISDIPAPIYTEKYKDAELRDEDGVFNPKFRIVIPQEKQTVTIYRNIS